MKPTTVTSNKTALLLLVIYLLYGGILVFGSNAGLPSRMTTEKIFPYLADKPIGEDGYYLLTVAWNLSLGKGFVYNFDLPTTGIQPLATIIFSVLAWVVRRLGGDQWVFIRVILAFGILSLAMFAHLLGTMARRLTGTARLKEPAYLLAFTLTLFNFELFRWFCYGLETGIYLILFSLLVLSSDAFMRGSGLNLWKTLVLGFLTGLTILARLDFGILLIIFLLLMLLRDATQMKWMMALGLTTLSVVSPWLYYVFSVTGSWMPSSGGAQFALIEPAKALLRVVSAASALLAYLVPWIHNLQGLLFLQIALIIALALGFLLFKPAALRQTLKTQLSSHPGYTYWFAAAFALPLIYTPFFWAYYFYPRYFAPLSIPIYCVTAFLLALRLNRNLTKGTYLVIGLSMLSFFTWAYLGYHRGDVDHTHSVTAHYIQEHYPNQVVGTFQSGIVGYANPNVINLDGKVNHQALKYQQVGAIHTYIDNNAITVLIDTDAYISKYIDNAWLSENWRPCPLPVPDQASVCYIRKP